MYYIHSSAFHAFIHMCVDVHTFVYLYCLRARKAAKGYTSLCKTCTLHDIVHDILHNKFTHKFTVHFLWTFVIRSF